MTTRVDIEEIASTKSEKFLALVLTVFILIGAGWAYSKTDDLVGLSAGADYTASEQRALDQQTIAADESFRADEARDSAQSDLDLAREDLSLAVDRDEPTGDLEQDYRTAQGTYDAARDQADQAKRALTAADETAQRADISQQARVVDDAWRAWVSAGLRLALVGALLLGGLRVILRVRERESRYLPLGFAVAGSGALMALVFAVDYVTDYIDLVDVGPIVLSLVGIVATIGAFAGLQKYLARRIPRSRVRKGECPFCAFPLSAAAGRHCEGCGRETVATCASCAAPRRVGSPHCATCGTA